jgi:hypothetical protein
MMRSLMPARGWPFMARHATRVSRRSLLPRVTLHTVKMRRARSGVGTLFLPLPLGKGRGEGIAPLPVAPRPVRLRAAELAPSGSDLSAWTIAAIAFVSCRCDETPSGCWALIRSQFRASCRLVRPVRGDSRLSSSCWKCISNSTGVGSGRPQRLATQRLAPRVRTECF